MAEKQKVDVNVFNRAPMVVRMLTAGTAACCADLIVFPCDTAKVRLQIQGEGAAGTQIYKGLFGTIATISRQEGPRGLYNGLVAGLQRQMCFASIRLGFYEPVKQLYQRLIFGEASTDIPVGLRILAGLTTGALSVAIAQPTDVVKIRYQAMKRGDPNMYSSTFQAYSSIYRNEGIKMGLWRGTIPNMGRNAIVNVAEIVCYDVIKDQILKHGLMSDTMPCHFTSALISGFITTFVASPVDVLKTRYMNAPKGMYAGVVDCAVKAWQLEGGLAFYKGFTPSFARLVAWNIVLWVTYEQFKIIVARAYGG